MQRFKIEKLNVFLNTEHKIRDPNFYFKVLGEKGEKLLPPGK